MASERASQQAFFGVSALLFAASAVVTIVWCASMSAMGEMPMPGGWTMSMAWMRMPGQTWPGAAASFLGMWVVMMVAMMLPSLVPMLRRYRQAVDRPAASAKATASCAEAARRRGETRRASTSEGAVRAPMQGTIVKVLVKEGQEVAADEPVCILEAMKMESEVRSQKAGTVSEVRVEAGQTVRSGETLISVE